MQFSACCMLNRTCLPFTVHLLGCSICMCYFYLLLVCLFPYRLLGFLSFFMFILRHDLSSFLTLAAAHCSLHQCIVASCMMVRNVAVFSLTVSVNQSVSDLCCKCAICCICTVYYSCTDSVLIPLDACFYQSSCPSCMTDLPNLPHKETFMGCTSRVFSMPQMTCKLPHISS